MRIDTKAFGIAAGLVAALTYIVCAGFVALAPAATQAAFSYVMHVDLTQISRSITVMSFAVGILVFSALVGVCASLVAWMYNMLVAHAEITLPRPATATR